MTSKIDRMVLVGMLEQCWESLQRLKHAHTWVEGEAAEAFVDLEDDIRLLGDLIHAEGDQ